MCPHLFVFLPDCCGVATCQTMPRHWLLRMGHHSTSKWDWFYSTRAWKQCRAGYLSQHPYCERCLREGIVRPAQHVHHKQYLTAESVNDPKIALNWDNLEALCIRHHNAEHYRRSEILQNDLYFDENGDITTFSSSHDATTDGDNTETGGS